MSVPALPKLNRIRERTLGVDRRPSEQCRARRQSARRSPPRAYHVYDCADKLEYRVEIFALWNQLRRSAWNDIAGIRFQNLEYSVRLTYFSRGSASP